MPLTLQRAQSLTDLVRAVRRAFYEQYDDPENGVYYYVEDVFSDHIVAYAEHETSFYRVGYTVTDSGVAFDAQASWQEVEQEWVPAQRDAKEAAKRELMSEAQPPSGEEVRSMPGFGRPMQRAFKPEVRFSSDGGRTTFKIMTSSIARDGMVLSGRGLDVAAYQNNPVVQYDHGQHPVRGSVPIGRCVDLQQQDGDWIATMEWEDDEFAQDIMRKVKRGTLNMASIRWRTLKVTTTEADGRQVPYIAESEMLEFSVVGVGADADALVQERRDSEATLSDLINEIRLLRAEIAGASGGEAQPPTEGASSGDNDEQATGQSAPSDLDDAATSGASGDGDPDANAPDGADDAEAVADEADVPDAERQQDLVEVDLNDLLAMKRQLQRERDERIRTTAKQKRGMA